MRPAAGMRAKVGAGYTGRMIEFSTDLWQPRIAAQDSPSLAGCLHAMDRWRYE
jgi:hypothetical protein